MRYWIYNGAIAGTSIGDVEPPQGFELVESDLDLPLEQIYYDGQAIKEKPPKPTPSAFWSEGDRAWITPKPPEPEANWEGLTTDLTGNAIWQKTYAASTQTLQANSAFTMLLAILTSTKRIDRLQIALLNLRSAMVETEAGDFDSSELEEIRAIAASNGFNPEDFDLD